jgi:glycerol-3-phosphate dehydrogenase
VEMPIAEVMHAMLYEALPPREAIRQLMDRGLKSE